MADPVSRVLRRSLPQIQGVPQERFPGSCTRTERGESYQRARPSRAVNVVSAAILGGDRLRLGDVAAGDPKHHRLRRPEGHGSPGGEIGYRCHQAGRDLRVFVRGSHREIGSHGMNRWAWSSIIPWPEDFTVPRRWMTLQRLKSDVDSSLNLRYKHPTKRCFGLLGRA